MVVVTAQHDVSKMYLWSVRECLPVEIMRLRVRHARERVLPS